VGLVGHALHLLGDARVDERRYGTIVPMMRPAPRMLEASWLGMNPSRSIAARMRSRVSGDTLSGSFRARETVIGETPTREAISRMPRRVLLVLRDRRGVASIGSEAPILAKIIIVCAAVMQAAQRRATAGTARRGRTAGARLTAKAR
jgi:hypothetical protein